jgi:hypothetical protein
MPQRLTAGEVRGWEQVVEVAAQIPPPEIYGIADLLYTI